jgi:uncharacterized membrane protein YsdA (DUF1294 family)/cold shock CspA family protein
MRYQGKIINWKDDQGFGFIAPSGGGKDIFVHIKSFSTRQRRPVGNEIVTYELKTDDKGRSQAVSVAFNGEGMPSISSVRPNLSFFLAIAFLVFVAASVFAGKLPLAVLWCYFVASIVAFIAYTLDKSAAKNHKWRTRESTLHFIALIGGWPGALAAQRLLNHKSKKQSFQIVFWATVIFNCGALGWLISPLGSKDLHSILNTMADPIDYYAKKLHFLMSGYFKR